MLGVLVGCVSWVCVRGVADIRMLGMLFDLGFGDELCGNCWSIVEH